MRIPMDHTLLFALYPVKDNSTNILKGGLIVILSNPILGRKVISAFDFLTLKEYS